jgi:hypothetical protein
MRKKSIIALALAGTLSQPVYAGQFPWESGQPVGPPPLNSVQPKTPQFRTPPVVAPTTPVPGHQSRYGYVPGYQSEGPVPVIVPGRKTQDWVPGHHDNSGAWVPGHPQ